MRDLWKDICIQFKSFLQKQEKEIVTNDWTAIDKVWVYSDQQEIMDKMKDEADQMFEEMKELWKKLSRWNKVQNTGEDQQILDCLLRNLGEPLPFWNETSPLALRLRL